MLSRRNFLSTGAAGLAGISALPLSATGHKERLTITKVELFPVNPPLQQGVLGKWDTQDFDTLPKFMLKVHTDSGIVGLGETHRIHGGLNSADGMGVRRAAAALVGHNVLDFYLPNLQLPVNSHNMAFEVAFYDIIGKAVGWPVWRLLGGLGQRKVLVHYWIGKNLSPEELRHAAQRAVDLGFGGIKIKRQHPLVGALKIFYSVSPKLKITVDLMGYYAGNFLPVLKEMESVGNVLVLEDPPPKLQSLPQSEIADGLAEYNRWSQETKIPIAIHLYVNRYKEQGMVNAMAANACSVFNLDAPNMAEWVANAHFAGSVGKSVYHASAHELGVLDASLLHACAAAPNCTYPSDILSYERVNNLLVKPLERRGSYYIVPDTPGLGVELDMDAVKRYAAKT
jgi:muconate cycloisomerase